MPVPVSRVLALDLPEGIDLGQAARYMGAKDGGGRAAKGVTPPSITCPEAA